MVLGFFSICRLWITCICTSVWNGWFKLYFILTWCLSPPCNPTVGVANKTAGPSREGNDLGSVRSNLSRQFKQGNVVRKSCSITIVIWVLKNQNDLDIFVTSTRGSFCVIRYFSSEKWLSPFCCLKLYWRYDHRDLLVKVNQIILLLMQTFVKDTGVWRMISLINLVTLTIMILLTAMVWEVEVSDWRCNPATARMFLALSKYKILLHVRKIKEWVFMRDNPGIYPWWCSVSVFV